MHSNIMFLNSIWAGGGWCRWVVFCYLLIFEFLHLEIIKKTSFFFNKQNLFDKFQKRYCTTTTTFHSVLHETTDTPLFQWSFEYSIWIIFLDWGGPPYFKTNVYSQYYMGSLGEKSAVVFEFPLCMYWNNYFHQYDICKFKRLKLY